MYRVKMFKRSGMAVFFFVCILFAGGSITRAKDAKGMVAMVNGTAISEKDFNRSLNQTRRRFAQTGKKLESNQLENVKKNILETLIDRELLYQESQKKGIKVTDEEIKKQIEGLRKQFSGNDAFTKALKSADLTEDELKDQVKKQLSVRALIDKDIAEKVKIENKESKAFYDSHPDIFKRPEEVRASHILAKVDSQADKKAVAKARKKIEAAQKRLNKGEDFAKVAREVSEGPSAKKGGDLGFFKRGQMVKPFEDAAFSMKPGQVSGIVRTRFGFHIIKVTDKKPESTVAFSKVDEKIKAYLKQKKVREGVQALIEKLKQHASIERFLLKTSK